MFFMALPAIVVSGFRTGPRASSYKKRRMCWALSGRDGIKAGKFPYLLKEVKIDHVNQVWSTDITCVRLGNGFAY